MMSASRCSLFRVPLVPLSTTPIVWDKKLTYKLRLEDQALVKRLVMKIVGHVPKSVLTSLGVTLATRCSQDVDLLEFFKAFGMPDTFYSWMLVAELHLWMLSVRIMAEEMKEGEDVVHFMMEAFWKDAEERFGWISRMILESVIMAGLFFVF